ncbi:MAG: hypothetical protein A2X49_03905 [Lentisphaerae bacterium GWF2_52_8]|nr:MAG: hypothetical protein A2X49_03905 [Lentisphaerae bacterium GWF2_52_8]
MFFSFAKNKELSGKLDRYLKTAEEGLLVFDSAIRHLLIHGVDEHFCTLALKIHKFESNADDIRRSIELDMYQKSLLPETREDLLSIIEIMDKIPNEAEAIANDFVSQKTVLFPEIREGFLELIQLSIETSRLAMDATRDCFGRRQRIAELARQVDNNESLGDAMERSMITKVFAASLDTGEKIIQKDFIIKLGNICDLCEDVLDRIVICSVKREH